MNYSLKVKKVGKSQFGQWVIGTLANDVIAFDGIFSMAKDYDLELGEVYSVKFIDIKQNKLNKLAIKIELN